jgi:hypothetical protein
MYNAYFCELSMKHNFYNLFDILIYTSITYIRTCEVKVISYNHNILLEKEPHFLFYSCAFILIVKYKLFCFVCFDKH